MSSPEESEPDAGREPDDGPESGRDAETSVPEQRSTPEFLVGNAVTRIMPVIAPWPVPGAEPPDPPPPRAVGAAQVVSRPDVADASDVPDTPGTAVVLAPRRSIDVVRSSPAVIAEDSWDETPSSDASSVGGRHPRLPSRRVWVVLVAVLTGLGAAIGVPFVLSSQPSAPTPAALDESPTELDEPPPGLTPTSTNVQSPTPMSTGGSATPARSPSPTQAQAANPTIQSTSAPPPPFEPLTIEAETGMTTGSAHIWDNYLGTSVDMVRNLGNWGGTPGTLTLNEIVFPNDAEYTITIHFAHPNDEDNRSALVTVSGLEAVTVNFTAVDTHCCFVTAVTVAIPAGTRSITFSNPTAHAPSIDKIIISRL